MSSTNPKPSVLARECVLVRQVRRSSGFKRQNATITREVEASHSANDAGSWQDKLIHKRFLEEINRALSSAYTAHIADTLPFEISGARLLPLKNKATYMEHQNAAKEALEDAVTSLKYRWDEALADARQRLNGLFDASKYPSASQLSEIWGIEIFSYPVPDPAGIFAAATEQDRAEMEAELTQRVQEISANAVYEIWRRLSETVETLRDRLKDYDANDDERKRFCSAWLVNLREVANSVSGLNFSDDPQLEAMRQRIERELCSADLETLKTSKEARRAIAYRADDIANALAGLAQ